MQAGRRRPGPAIVRPLPERLERRPCADPACARGPGAAALAPLGERAHEIDLAGGHEQDRQPREALEDARATAAFVNSVSILWKRCRSASSGGSSSRSWRDALGLGEDPGQALDRRLRVVGHHQLTLRAPGASSQHSSVAPPTPYEANRVDAAGVEQLADAAGARLELGVLVGRPLPLLARLGEGEGAARPGAERVPGLGANRGRPRRARGRRRSRSDAGRSGACSANAGGGERRHHRRHPMLQPWTLSARGGRERAGAGGGSRVSSWWTTARPTTPRPRRWARCRTARRGAPAEPGVCVARNRGFAETADATTSSFSTPTTVWRRRARRAARALDADPRLGFAYGHQRFFGEMSGEFRFPPYDPYRCSTAT